MMKPVELVSEGTLTNTYIVCGTKFELERRFELLDPMGQGAYGVVVAARDHEAEDDEEEEENLVAIKKIERAFEHKVFMQRTLRELKIQRLLQHENIIGIKTILQPKSREEFNDIYIVSDLMETDLGAIIKSTQALTDEHIQFFLYQILRGLKYMHSAGILHRDLKPRNLLVNTNCDLKICDFGLARADIPLLQTNSVVLTDYITTRWYRAPEVLLSWKKYSKAIDVWSVGCILAEMIMRKPLFPGHEQEEQVQMIINVLGYPSSPEVQEIFNEFQDQELIQNIEKVEGKDLAQLFAQYDPNPQAIDLLKRFLEFDPTKRITVEKALEHPYLENLHVPEDEPTTEQLSAFDFDYEIYDLKKEEYKDLIYEEILLYHSEEMLREYIENKKKYPDGMLHLKYGGQKKKAKSQKYVM